MRMMLVKYMGFQYPLYQYFTLFSNHAAVFKHQISEASVVMLEYRARKQTIILSVEQIKDHHGITYSRTVS